MGKAKLGKQRKDKFYKLAKETGFRSRASFKLIQLNRKFEFLQKSRVLVDLCAAPGGWLQVAQQSMPVSALIIGVDLVPIKPIPNVITLQEDITTDKCRQAIKKQLKTWKADVVLNDGAPNVGKSWVHDAFAQSQLTLSALKLATEILMPGGWFITKVFRSKDYNTLLWVFGKLFKKVHVTKPQASRNESAEIFIVCQSYIAPDKIDPKFLDSSHLFKEVEEKVDLKKNLLKPPKKKKAEGYEEGDKSVFSQLKASEFIFNDNYLELLVQCSEIVFDDADIRDHRTTTEDIKEYCKDIKVLGKGEIKALLNWRKNLHSSIKGAEKKENDVVPAGNEDRNVEEMVEIENAENEAQDLEIAKYKELKRKKKQVLKEKRKLRERIELKMVIKGDEPIIQEDLDLFSMKTVKSKKDLDKLEAEKEDECEENDGEYKYPDINPYRNSYVSYDKHDELPTWTEAEDTVREEKGSSDSEDDEDMQFETTQNQESEGEGEIGEDDGNISDTLDDQSGNPLLLNLASKNEMVSHVVSTWFDKEDFKDLDEENELDLELLAERIAKRTQAEGSGPAGKPDKIKSILKKPTEEPKAIQSDDEDEEDEDQVVPVKEPKKKKKRVRLDPEGLALGTLMIKSKKMKRDIMDNAYNRFASNDENLPDWFVEDEKMHYRKPLPVTSEMVEEYKAKLREINARPIKKVIEAKARKKRRALKKMEKAKKRAEAITDNPDMSEKEKVAHLKSIYKKALAKKKDEVTYVVAKKATARKGGRPPGVKGRYKMVDKRMKKDDRRKKMELKSKKKPRKNMTKMAKKKKR